jgi:hypothetical protein
MVFIGILVSLATLPRFAGVRCGPVSEPATVSYFVFALGDLDAGISTTFVLPLLRLWGHRRFCPTNTHAQPHAARAVFACEVHHAKPTETLPC